MSNSEIVLLTDNYLLDDITTIESRDKLCNTLSRLDQRLLTEDQLRSYFEGLKLAMGAFIQRVNSLESSIYELKRDQAAAEARMEAMYLKAQLEIQELKTEISEMRLSKNRINQIVKVAQSLQGNPYAPYAVKSMVDGVMRSSRDAALVDNTKLPDDFTTRLDFAKKNGFKWNQNNRVPSRPAKQLKVLEEWENQFCQAESLSVEDALNKSHVVKLGAGAVAGALMILERELGGTLSERETMSVFNCYQKAIKLYKEKGSTTTPSQSYLDIEKALFMLFPSHAAQLTERFKSKKITSPEGLVKEIKKAASKTILPLVSWREENASETDKLYSIQSGGYDKELIEIINEALRG